MMFQMMALFVMTSAVLAQPGGGLKEPKRIEDPPRPTRQSEPARQFNDVDELLDAIDEADHSTHSLAGTLRHIVVDALAGDTQVRDGKLVLSTDWRAAAEDPTGLPVRRFSVQFHTLIVDGRKTVQARHYIFDGEWMMEKDYADKQANRWQLVPPGQRFDPMDRLGGSAVWIPVGQDASELRKRFEVELLESTDWFEGEDMPAGLTNYAERDGGTVQLRLVPKPGSGLEDSWDEIRMWFDRRTLLPRVHVVLEPTGDEQISILYDVRRNVAIEVGTFATEPPAAEGWEGTEHPYRKSVEADADE